MLSSGKNAVRSAGGNTGTNGAGTIPAYPFGKSDSVFWVESRSVVTALFLKIKGKSPIAKNFVEVIKRSSPRDVNSRL